MTNGADPDQLAYSEAEANWSGTTLFAKAGHIRVQQDKGSGTRLLRQTNLVKYTRCIIWC